MEGSDIANQQVFVKSIQSDVDASNAVTLLTEAFQSFENDLELLDLQMLAEVMSVIKLNSGEQLIKKGENASFFCLLLEGSVQALITDTFKVTMGKGAMFGEMAYFQGGVRSADIVTTSDVTLSVMSFKEMDALLPTAPALQNKLVKILARAGFSKLNETRKRGHYHDHHLPCARVCACVLKCMFMY